MSSNKADRLKFRQIPGNIRDLLCSLIDRTVTIVLCASTLPEIVVVENVVGNLLVAESNASIKFVDINCICEVIVSREELLDVILGVECCKPECGTDTDAL